MKVSMTLTRKKFTLDKIINRIQESIDKEVRTGFFAEDVHSEGMYIANIAVIQDNGLPAKNIPPRPFMSVGLRSLLKSLPYKRMYKSLIIQILTGKKKVTSAYTEIGRFAAEDLKDIISQWSSPPNALSTQAIKGFNDPLVDTGQMRDSVKSKVSASRKRAKYKMRSRPSRVR